MKQKRILMIEPVDISKDYAPKIHFLNLAVNFNKLGCRTKVILYSPEKRFNIEEKKLIDMKFIPNPLTGNKLERIVKYLLSVPLMIVELFSFRPTIIYFRFSPPTLLYLTILRLIRFFFLDFQIVLEFNDWVSEERDIQGEGKLKVKLINFLEVKSALFVDYIRVVAESIKSRLLKYKIREEKILVVENGTDINHFKPINKREAKKKIGVNPDLLYVGFIGNFAVWQGISFVFSIIPRILKEFDNVRFILVGDGTEMTKAKRKIRSFKNEEVKITGFVPYKDANFYINSFDIGLAPYIKDAGFSPLKIRDYAACGIPTVSSRIKGAQFIEDEDIGILFPVGDADSLHKSLQKLIKDADLRKKMGLKGRKFAEEKLSWQRVAERVLKEIGS